MNEAVPISSQGALVVSNLFAMPGAVYGVYVDVDGGPIDVLGERLLLGASPVLGLFDGGIMPAGGLSTRMVQVPLFAGLLGTVVYGQAVALDPTAPNGLFLTSNAASTAIYAGSSAFVADFENPYANGYSGTAVSDFAGHMSGAPVTRRVVETITPNSFPFPIPIQPPLSPFGARAQFVYRTIDVAATGQPELVTAVRWRLPAAGSPIPQLDTFPAFDFRIGHTDVVPDYSVDSFTALPVAPNSGLSPTFAANERPGQPPLVVYQGAYTVSPNDLLPGGWLPYPMFTPFTYDGVSSLLLDFRVQPGISQGFNGMAVRLQVQSDPRPGARCVASGTATAPILPNQVTTGSADNAMPEFQFEFTRAISVLQSPWEYANAQLQAYGTPVVAKSLPFGTSIAIEYRGSPVGSDATATAWSSSPAVADGLLYLQFRITFHANLLTGERPILDTLVVPRL
jgi:hypothetical protein